MKNKKKTIVFDVDGTLIDLTEPREDVIALLRMFVSLGWEIWVHSGGGVYYASRWARHLKLDELTHIHVDVKGSKRVYDIAVDDCADEMTWCEGKQGNYVRAKVFIKV